MGQVGFFALFEPFDLIFYKSGTHEYTIKNQEYIFHHDNHLHNNYSRFDAFIGVFFCDRDGVSVLQ